MLHRYLLSLSYLFSLFRPAILQQPCQDQRVLSYHFESRVNSFANASKIIRFQSDFQLQCINFVPADTSQEYLLTFTSLRHLIEDIAPPSQKRRKRKPPPLRKDNKNRGSIPFSQGEQEPASESSFESDNSYKKKTAKQLDTWQNLPLSAVKFVRHFTGVISTFTFSFEDRSQATLSSLKRSIAQHFQTNTRQDRPEVLEVDELGEHWTSYSFPNDSADSSILLVHKYALSDQFVELQNSAVNEGNIKVDLYGEQKYKAGIMLESDLTVNTEMAQSEREGKMSFQTQDDIKGQFSVSLHSQIQLTGQAEYSDLRWSHDLIGSPQSANQLLADSGDRLKYLEVTLKQATEMLNRFDLKRLIELFKRDSSKLEILRPLQTALDAEAQLYSAGRISQRKVFSRVFPLLGKNLEECVVQPDWRFCVNIFQTALQTGDHRVEQYFASLFDHPSAFKLARNRLLNVVMFQQLPTDGMIDFLFALWSRKDLAEARSHILLAIGAVGSRGTISVLKQQKTAIFLSQQLSSSRLILECDAVDADELAKIDAVSNFLSTSSLERIGSELSGRLLEQLRQLLKTCHFHERDTPLLSVITALAKCHKHASVVPQLLTILEEADCERKLQIVESLIKLMDYNKSEWPARQVNEVDYHLATDYLARSRSVECARSALHSYFQRKHLTPKTPRWKAVFGRIYNSPELVRRKRQEEATTVAGPVHVEVVYDDWTVGSEDRFAAIQSASKFEQDKANYPTRRHLLVDVTLGVPYAGIYFRTGFFSGKDAAKGSMKLFGKLVADVQIGVVISLGDIEFLREIVVAGGLQVFNGRVVLKALGYSYLDYTMYTCNHTIDDLSWAYTFTAPAWSITFSGFALTMGASFEVRFVMYLWPSYCEEGDHGVRWKPTTILQADAYGEIGYDPYFGLGAAANMYFDYFVDALIRMPDACLFIYHGNNDMQFTIHFYLKLPEFTFVNFNPVAVVSQKMWNIFKWVLVLKKAGKWTLFGFCPPGQIYEPEAPTWDFDTTI